MTNSPGEQIKSELEAGTWTSFQARNSKNPKVTLLKSMQKKRKSPNEGITILDIPFEPTYDFTGSRILSAQDVEMEVYARNDTDRDALFDDIETIFKASSYDLTLHNVNFKHGVNKYKIEMVATILM